MKSKKKPIGEIKFTNESTLKPGDKFRLKATGEILIYLRPSDKQFQKGHLLVFRDQAGEEVEYESNEVEKID